MAGSGEAVGLCGMSVPTMGATVVSVAAAAAAFANA